MHKINSALTLLLLALSALCLSACGQSGLTVSVDFTNTQDIQVGSPVYFESNKIGQVSDVQLDGVGSKIEIKLDEQAAQFIHSNAAVVVNRLKQGMPLEIYNRATFERASYGGDASGGTISDQSLIQDGQTLHGLNSMLELGAWMIGDAIQLGAGTAAKMVESFQEYLQGDEFQQDKQNINTQLQTARDAAVVAVQDLHKNLSQAAADFKISEQLAAQSVTQLGEELAPVIEGLAATGAHLVEQVEQLEQSLAQMQPEQREAGEQLLESLLATIDRLNQSLQVGLAKQKPNEPAP